MIIHNAPTAKEKTRPIATMTSIATNDLPKSLSTLVNLIFSTSIKKNKQKRTLYNKIEKTFCQLIFIHSLKNLTKFPEYYIMYTRNQPEGCFKNQKI